MMFIEEAKAIFNSKELLLLDDLSIDLRRPYSLDLGNKVVTYPLGCLAVG